MKIRYITCFSLGWVVGLMSALHSCSSFSQYPHDNILEEGLEEAIFQKSGYNIDLTPFSPEKK